MKKLLSLLGSIVLAGSSASVVVSCSYAPSIKKVVNRETNFYSQVSAEALKEGVLADQNLDIQGKTSGIDTSYSSSYFSSENILNRFGNLFNPKQGGLPTGDTEVSSLFKDVFGTDGGGDNYTIANSYGSLKSANGVKKDSRLWDLINNSDSDNAKNLQAPDGSLSSTLNLVSGAANIVFKNDFSPSMGKTLISLLTSGTVKGVITGDSGPKIKGYFNLVNDALTQYRDQIMQIASSVTQSDVATDAIKDNSQNTYNQQLINATNKLFGGLIYFVTQKKYVYVNTIDSPNTVSAVSAFWNYILSSGKNTNGLTSKEDHKETNTQDILESVSGIVSFGITLLHYFRAFDQKYKLIVPTDGTHIFDTKKSNGEVIAEVLNSPYVDPSTMSENLSGPAGASNITSDNFWYYDGTTYSTKLNLQNLVSDLNYYLRPVDSKGYQTLRAFTILLGGPLQAGTDTVPQFNPILSTVLEPLIAQVGGNNGLLAGLIKSKLSFLPDSLINTLVNDILKVGQKGARELIDWFVTNGDDGFGDTISGLISPIADIISKIDLSQFADDDTKVIFAAIDAVAQYLANNNNGKKFLIHPWKQIFSGGLLTDVGKLMKKIAPQDDTITAIGHGLIGLRDLRTILTMDLSTVVKNVGYMMQNKNLSLPSFLYKLNKMSASDVLQYLSTSWLASSDKADPSNNYNSAGTNKLDDNNKYSFNTAALSNVVNSLVPNSEAANIKSDDSNVLQPQDVASTDNSQINVLSAIQDQQVITITLDRPLIKKIPYTDLAVTTSDGTKMVLDKNNVKGLQSGSSTVTIYGVPETPEKGTAPTISLKGLKTSTQPVYQSSDAEKHNIASRTMVFTYDNGKVTPVTPIMSLYDSIKFYGTNKAFGKDDQDKPSGTYYVKLAGETYDSPVHEISSDKPFAISKDSTGVKDESKAKITTSNVSSEAFENLLGANDTGDTTSFKPSSLLMSLSNLYGHWDPNGGGTWNQENANASESIIGLLGAVAKLASDSMTQIQNDVYAKYFDPKNWKITNLQQQNLEHNDESMQKLSYDLKFYNPDAGKWFTYEVAMHRDPKSIDWNNSTSNTTGLIVDKLMLQD